MLLEVFQFLLFSILIHQLDDEYKMSSFAGGQTPLTDNLNRAATPKQQQNAFGTLAVPFSGGQTPQQITPTIQGAKPEASRGQIFRQPKEANTPQSLPDQGQNIQGQVQGQPSSGLNLLKAGIEKEMQRSGPKHSTDLLLLQLKNDIVVKAEARPSTGQGLLFQTKVEINDININLDPEIVVNIFEYQSEINRIHQIRCAQLKEFGSSYFDQLKFEAEKQVITFQNRPRGTSSPQRGISKSFLAHRIK